MKVYVKNIYKVAFFISLFDLLLLLIDFGFEQSEYFEKLLNGFYFIVLSLGAIGILSRYCTFIGGYRDFITLCFSAPPQRKMANFALRQLPFRLFIGHSVSSYFHCDDRTHTLFLVQ